MRNRMRTWVTSTGLAAGLLTVAACSGSGSSGDTAAESSTGGDAAAATSAAPGAPDQAAPPEPDVADVPDVVAEVNGEEIAAEEFVEVYESRYQQAVAQAQATGQPVDQEQLKTQTADGMVANMLLVQEADRREITSSPKEVDATLDELAASNGLGSSEELLTLLEEQGTTEQDARTQVETQVKVDKLIAEEAPATKPTEAELQELYDSLAQDQGAQGGLPPFEEVRPQLEEQLQAEQESTAVVALVDRLRADGDVTVNL